jgi:hypothetical protein
MRYRPGRAIDRSRGAVLEGFGPDLGGGPAGTPVGSRAPSSSIYAVGRKLRALRGPGRRLVLSADDVCKTGVCGCYG